MKKINLLLGVVLVFVTLAYLLLGKVGFDSSSSTLYATYIDSSLINCSSSYYGDLACSGNNVLVCIPGSGWKSVATCNYGCSEGVCIQSSASTTIPTEPVSCSSTSCSACSTYSACSSAGCYWDLIPGVCLTRPPTGVACDGPDQWCISVQTCGLEGGTVDGSCWTGSWQGCCTISACGGTCVAASSCGGDTLSGHCDSGVCCKDASEAYICDEFFSCQDLGFNSCYKCTDGQCVYSTSICPSSTPTLISSSPTSTPGDEEPVNGDCGSSPGTCDAGAPGNGNTKNTSAGMNYTWSCIGSNGGVTANCETSVCSNQPVTNGTCQSGVVGCYSGALNYNSVDANGDYINDSNESEYVWNCVGSRKVCAESDGTDQLGCVATIDQGNWFQINNGNVLAKGIVTNYVPITAVNGTGGYSSTVNNGKVYSKNSSSLSNYDQAGKTEESSFNFKTYAYSQLKSDYFDAKGVGTTFVGGTNWSTVKNATGVIFVDGNLEINSDLVTTNFVMIVAKGTIIIDPNVTRVDAILVADKVVVPAADDSVSSVAQLVINGMVHGVSGVEFKRSLVPKSLNNTSPSVKVNYNPELLFMVPEELAKSFSQWKVN